MIYSSQSVIFYWPILSLMSFGPPGGWGPRFIEPPELATATLWLVKNRISCRIWTTGNSTIRLAKALVAIDSVGTWEWRWNNLTAAETDLSPDNNDNDDVSDPNSTCATFGYNTDASPHINVRRIPVAFCSIVESCPLTKLNGGLSRYLGYTLRMRTLFRGWPIMLNDTHKRRRRRRRLQHVVCENAAQI